MKVLSQLEAGQCLATRLAPLVRDTPLVIAITPGGAAVGAELAAALTAPLDILTVLRLEVPGRSHSTFGAVADGAVVLTPERVRDLGLPSDYVDFLVAQARSEAERVTHARRGSEAPMPLAGRTVILVDDGSTEATLAIGAATALRRAGVARLIFAAPQVGPELARALETLTDTEVLLEEPGFGTQVRDPRFSHTTEFDIHALVSRNRKSTPSLPVASI